MTSETDRAEVLEEFALEAETNAQVEISLILIAGKCGYPAGLGDIPIVDREGAGSLPNGTNLKLRSARISWRTRVHIGSPESPGGTWKNRRGPRRPNGKSS